MRKIGFLSVALLILLSGLDSCAPRSESQREAAVPPARGSVLRWVQGPAGRLRAVDGGREGIPVVFVHGLGGDRRVWAAQLDHLWRTRRAVAIDLRGHGESDPAPELSDGFTMEAFARDVEAVVRALGFRKYVLVGHSMGGAVIGAQAGLHPREVAGLLFVDAVGDLRQIPRPGLASWLEGFSEESYDAYWPAWLGEMLAPAKPEVREQVRNTFAATPQAVVRESVTSIPSYDPIPALTSYGGPMLAVVTPENNRPFSLQNAVPGLPSRVVEGTSHWIMMDSPEAFNAILDEFLAGAE